MPFGQIEQSPDIARIKDLITGFGDRYVRNQMAIQQQERDRLDRENAVNMVNTWADAVKPKADGKYPTADDVYAGLSNASAFGAQNNGPRTQGALADVQKQASIYKEFHPVRDANINAFDVWRAQHPAEPIENYYQLLTNQSVQKGQRVKPVLIGQRKQNINGVDVLGEVYGYKNDDGTTVETGWKPLSPQLRPDGGGAGAPKERGPKTQLGIQLFKDDPSEPLQGGHVYTKAYQGPATQVSEQVQRDKLSYEDLLKPYTEQGLNLNRFTDTNITPSIGDPEIARIKGSMKDKRRAVALIQSWQRLVSQGQVIAREGYGVGERFSPAQEPQAGAAQTGNTPDPRIERARSVLKGNGYGTDDASVQQFLKNNPGF